MQNSIETRFGTVRGLARLVLSYAEVIGGVAPILVPEEDSVRRLVFLCHGNICRSPFAAYVAKNAGRSTASFGLSTTTGLPAHPPVQAIAKTKGYDLTPHHSMTVEDFTSLPGDLLVAMEVRHLRKLAAVERLRSVPRILLGCHLDLPIPHLHDPYSLGERYMKTCLERIEKAVFNLCETFPEG